MGNRSLLRIKKGREMKTLKEKIREKMVLTNEDKLIFEILEEQPNLAKYEKRGRKAFRKLVIEKCRKCDLHWAKCLNLLNPEFTKNWEFKCFISKEENEK